MDAEKYHNQLFISADNGARSGFVGSWIQDELASPAFDVGVELGAPFYKSHINSNLVIQHFKNKKIRIRPSIELLNVHMYLSLIKDVYTDENIKFDHHENSLETFSKMYGSAINWFRHDQEVDLSYYDKVIGFADTFDTDAMIDLYKWYNNRLPSTQQVEILKSTNEKNWLVPAKNSACSVAAMIFSREKELGLKEHNRLWTVIREYHEPDTDTLYDRIFEKITPCNYNDIQSHQTTQK
jgi:hypothetical protein